MEGADVPAAMAELHRVVEHDGSAVVSVRSDALGVTVSVAPPLAVALPVGADARGRAEPPVGARRAAAGGR